MEYEVNLAGFEGQRVAVKTSGLFSGPVVTLNGQPAAKGAKRGQFLLRHNDGTEALCQLKIAIFLDPVPRVTIDGITVQIAPPMAWYHWVWVGLPVAGLIAAGGLIGGLCGGIAATINGRIFRTDNNIFVRYLYTGAVSFLAIFAYLVLAIGISLATRRL